MWQPLCNLASYCKNPRCRDGFAGCVGHNRFVMWRSVAVINALFCFGFIGAQQAAAVDAETGGVRGTVFIVDSETGRSVMPGATVRLKGGPSLPETVTDQYGNYT